MSIVINEYKWAENAIKNKTLRDKPFESLVRIARYYIYNSKDKKEVRDLLKKYIVSCGDSSQASSLENKIDLIMSCAEKRSIYMIDRIDITVSEIDKIKQIKSVQEQRLAFTLLCISKFFTITNPKTDHWVPTPDNEIMKMANVNTSIKRQSSMYAHLRDIGMVRFSNKVDNLSVQVLFCSDDDEIALSITDFRNIGDQYMNYINGGYYFCDNCGIICKRNKKSDRAQKYCVDCALKIHMKQKVESVMRKRGLIENVDICNSL